MNPLIGKSQTFNQNEPLASIFKVPRTEMAPGTFRDCPAMKRLSERPSASFLYVNDPWSFVLLPQAC